MADLQVSPEPFCIPPEMVAFVASEAERDGDRVMQFLHSRGVHGIPENPNGLAARFLLHLGAALRLVHWEAQGFSLHRTAGLPDARQALQDAFRHFTEPEINPTVFCCSVIRLSCDSFAWHARRDFNADVAIDEMMDDDALDVVAKFLWSSRRSATAPDGPNP
jgi:hypothetical protein